MKFIDYSTRKEPNSKHYYPIKREFSCGESDERYYGLVSYIKRFDLDENGKEYVLEHPQKYSIFTNFYDIKTISEDMAGTRRSIEDVPLEEHEKVIDFEKERLKWRENLENVQAYKKLFDKQMKGISLKTATVSTCVAVTLPALIATIYGTSDANEFVKIMGSFVTSSALCGILVNGGLDYSDYLIKKNEVIGLDPFGKELCNSDLKVAAYYNILYETLAENPDIDRIEELNKLRKKALSIGEKDTFSKDVDKFARVRQ